MQNPVSNDDNQLIVDLILSGDPRGAELLYKRYSKGLSYLAKRHCPRLAEDCMHDTIVAALEQISDGKLESAVALPGYLVVILKRIAWSKTYSHQGRECNGEVFEKIVSFRADEGSCPNRELEVKRNSELMCKGLKQLKPREQEILTRFYLHEEDITTIGRAMRLSEQQATMLKYRSKQRLQSFVNKENAIPTRRRLESIAV